jgi:long-chain acyl-CoA synthetase
MNAAEFLGLADPGRAALVDGERRVSYGELWELVRRTAGGLRAGGVIERSQVPIVAGTEVDFVVAFFAVLWAGGIAVPLNPRAPLAEQERRLSQLDPVLTLVGDSPPPLPSGLEPVLGVAGRAGDDVPAADSGHPGDPSGAGTAGGGSDAAALLYTSGVTGSPQLTILTHANLVASREGLAGQHGAELDHATVGLCVLPLAHVFGLSSMLGAVLQGGGTVVLAREFDAAATVDLVSRHGVDAITAVPQMWAAWAEWARAQGGADAGRAFAAVRRATSGATHLPSPTWELVRDGLDVQLVEGYGLTETTGTVCRGSLPARPGSVGRPLGPAEVRLVDDAGHDAAVGDRGQIWIRGPQVAAGYWRDPEATRVAFGSNGWHRTGDVGVLDDEGDLYIVDRHKDIVIVSGFNVSPAEVEDVLVAHPSVMAAAVTGAPDDRTGEQVVARVVASGPELSVDELLDHCRRYLARYKIPSRIEVADELPLSASGKTLRRTPA